jgi:hypothetical protein
LGTLPGNQKDVSAESGKRKVKIKRKEYERLVSERDRYLKILNETSLIIEMPNGRVNATDDFQIPEMLQLMNISLYQMHLIAYYGGYDNHTTEVINGPFAIRFITKDQATGYEHFLYHKFRSDGHMITTMSSAQTTELYKES